MRKSSVLAKELEKLESDIRVYEQKLHLSTEQIKSLEANLEREMSKNRSLDVHAHTLEIKVNELTTLLDGASSEISTYRSQVSRKLTENEEIVASNSALVAEVRPIYGH
jgi:chromosome segregation ATPase